MFRNAPSESGYTLVETVVAMALFLSVLIPLVTTVGNVMFDRKSLLLQKSLVIAQTEMNRTLTKRDYVESTRMVDDGIVIERKIQRRPPVVEVQVTARTSGEQSRELLSLRKIVVDYEAFR